MQPLDAIRPTTPARRAGTAAALTLAMLTGCTTAPPATLIAPPPAAPATAGVPPAAMAYLYGSGEAAALSEQAYNAMVGYVRGVVARARDRRGRLPHQRAAGTLPAWPGSVVLAAGTTAARPDTLPCAALPPAVVLDMDETVVANLGYEYDEAISGRPYDAERWARWERGGVGKAVALPGAVRAFRALRTMGVAVVVNTNRSAANAADTARALAAAGLGEFRHGDTLFLKGDVDGSSGKDGRRRAIAQRYCVLAMAGDQLGDFADLFNPPGRAPAQGRRLLPSTSPLAARWGQGWFMLPNPVYGTGLGAGWDETFPAATRWSDAP